MSETVVVEPSSLLFSSRIATVANRIQRKKNASTRAKRRRRPNSGTGMRSIERKIHLRPCLATNSKDRENVLKTDPNMWLLPETKEYLKLDRAEPDEEPEAPRKEGKSLLSHPRIIRSIVVSFQLFTKNFLPFRKDIEVVVAVQRRTLSPLERRMMM